MFNGCSFILPISQGASEGGGQRRTHITHGLAPKLAIVYCALGDLRPLGDILPSESPPSSECCVCVEQDPHHGVSARPCPLTAACRQ